MIPVCSSRGTCVIPLKTHQGALAHSIFLAPLELHEPYKSPGSPANECSPSVGTAVGAVADPTGGGWVVGSNGTIATQGNAPCYGPLAGQTLNAPIVGIASTPDGKGYWLVASDGGVFSFGDAVFYGSISGKPLNKPIVGIAATPDGGGYWLVASETPNSSNKRIRFRTAQGSNGNNRA